MDDEAGALKDAFVVAYPQYVARLLVERGIEIGEVLADAIVEGTAVLDGLLTTLLDTPPLQQRHSPLELFREALRPVDRALTTIGAPRPAVDGDQRRLHPWDGYALSPGSSQVLGTAAHDAHLSWGIRKAMMVGALSSPVPPDQLVVALLCRKEDRDQLTVALRAAGYRTSAEVGEDTTFALVDVDHVDRGTGSDAVQELVRSGVRVVAYGDQITDLVSIGLQASGVWKVVSRSAVLADLSLIVPIVT